MTVQILRGNALNLPLADNTVDLVVTSPPYFGLRSYTDAGEHYDGQIGSEATPAEFLDALIAATAEMVRVVKPSGSIWVNLGDKYSSNANGSYAHRNASRDRNHTIARSTRGHGIPEKSLMGLPWRYALRCIDDLGLILRAEVIWSKPNGLPESVTDRVRRSHEQWFHFTLEPRYYSAVDTIREEHAPVSIARSQRNRFAPDLTQNGVGSPNTLDPTQAVNPLGKLPGSVWQIPTQPLTVPASLGVDHFAAYPMEWPRRIIQGWSPSGICTACGQGRRPVMASEQVKSPAHGDGSIMGHRRSPDGMRGWDGLPRFNMERAITGESCGCETPDAPTRPAVVLDPFGGTGTTALVAHALGRHGIHVDMSADYNRLARWRTTDPAQLAAALQVDKPAPVIEGQLDLLEGIA